MIPLPPRSTRSDTLVPSTRSSDLSGLRGRARRSPAASSLRTQRRRGSSWAVSFLALPIRQTRRQCKRPILPAARLSIGRKQTSERGLCSVAQVELTVSDGKPVGTPVAPVNQMPSRLPVRGRERRESQTRRRCHADLRQETNSDRKNVV